MLLLLKSSDRVAHDLCDARRLCSEAPPEDEHKWVLVLRKWSNLRPSGEFRCFRCGGQLLAACQRDRYSHYPFLAEEREQLLQVCRPAAAPRPTCPAHGRRMVAVGTLHTGHVVTAASTATRAATRAAAPAAMRAATVWVMVQAHSQKAIQRRIDGSRKRAMTFGGRAR